MTDQQHPTTPPPELVEQWHESWFNLPRGQHAPYKLWMAAQAARWGTDQELEACCEEMKNIPSPLGIPFGEMASNALRAARRPKPPSLKEQAMKALDEAVYMADDTPPEGISADQAGTIRRALESLPE